MPSPPAQYFYFGRLTLLFYIFIFIKLASIQETLPPRFTFISKLLLGIAFIGDIGTYWLSEAFGFYLRTIAFWYLEFPALVLLLIYWFALASYQSIKRQKAHLGLWLLPLSMVAVSLIQYLPHSFLLVILTTGSFKHFPKH